MAPVDAFFESVSGLTTTGATVITDIEVRLSRPLLLWRSVIQGLGGMGIVVLFVAVFPNVGVGGKHMFRGEVPGTTAEGLRRASPRRRWCCGSSMPTLTLVLLVALCLTGRRNTFESLCHAFTTMSTGGFSTRDGSVGGLSQPRSRVRDRRVHVLGSVNYALYYVLLRTRSLRGLLRNTELRVFVAVAVVSVLAVTLGTLHLYDGQLLPRPALRLFAVGTFMSSTGFTTSDHALYPPPVLGLVLVLMFMGGCSGSTAGGMKVERLVLIAKQAVSQVKRSFRPNVIDEVRLGRQAVAADVLVDVSAFFAIFFGDGGGERAAADPHRRAAAVGRARRHADQRVQHGTGALLRGSGQLRVVVGGRQGGLCAGDAAGAARVLHPAGAVCAGLLEALSAVGRAKRRDTPVDRAAAGGGHGAAPSLRGAGRGRGILGHAGARVRGAGQLRGGAAGRGGEAPAHHRLPAGRDAARAVAGRAVAVGVGAPAVRSRHPLAAGDREPQRAGRAGRWR
jgi:hypothetical protein